MYESLFPPNKNNHVSFKSQNDDSWNFEMKQKLIFISEFLNELFKSF